MNFIISLSIYFLITCQISISSETPKFCSMIDSPDVKLLHIVCLTGIICSSIYVSHVVLKKWYNLILISSPPSLSLNPITHVRNLHYISQFCPPLYFENRVHLPNFKSKDFKFLKYDSSDKQSPYPIVDDAYTHNFLYSWSIVQIIEFRP